MYSSSIKSFGCSIGNRVARPGTVLVVMGSSVQVEKGVDCTEYGEYPKKETNKSGQRKRT